MHLETIFAGFGGQGVLMAGHLLAQAGMLAGKQVTWVPSYGPEMRGGVANCAVIVSDHSIGSPVVGEPDAVIALNRPSMEKFGPMVKPGGVLIINSSLMENTIQRQDIQIVEVPCNDIADELGNVRVVNMVSLGALIEKTGVVTVDDLVQALRIVLPERRHTLIPLNQAALDRGAAVARGDASALPAPKAAAVAS